MSDLSHLVHWADKTAELIIRGRGEKKGPYTVASGISPSGRVHFGNFREVITADLVARALRERGKEVRFILSWDDYDSLQKIPSDLPGKKELEKYLFRPLVSVPCPYGKESSYGQYNEKKFEGELKRVGVEVEFIYQSEKYRSGSYRQSIALAMAKRGEIRKILNAHRSEPLPENWLPINIYCQKCGRDIASPKHITYSEEKREFSYSCPHPDCGYRGTEELEKSTRLKLPWRVDWPMRWAYEKVDFEPGGKDHSSQGGSYTTAKEIVKIFNGHPPVYLQYDFVSIKGRGGKMSSSTGEVLTIDDVLKIYSPEMIRWRYASFRPNVDFSISFDLDVIKTYEDFDRQERLATGQEKGNPQKTAMALRTFALSRLNENETGGKDKTLSAPFRPPFRHLLNILQINGLSPQRSISYYRKLGKIKNEEDQEAYYQRAYCAVLWLLNEAPENFKFSLNRIPPKLSLAPNETKFLTILQDYLTQTEPWPSDKELHSEIYRLIKESNLEPKTIFPILYRILINREQGPKLASFICSIGKEKVLSLLGDAL